MPAGKVKIYHFHNGAAGGVLSVIRNLFRFSSDTGIENHIIHVIDKDKHPGGYSIDRMDGAVSEQVFYYSRTWNFYYTCRQLARLLPDDKAVISAHDWLELGMASTLGLQNPVVQFLHGGYDYYYQLAKRHKSCIDIFIGVSETIAARLKKLEPEREASIFFRHFPVPPVRDSHPSKKGFSIIYVVRDINDENKNFKLLPAINNLLLQKGLAINWTIIGGGKTQEEFDLSWGRHKNFTYFQSLPNEKILDMLSDHHLFILPSFNEGFPVTVVEAMKAGCLPLISDWNGATAQLVIDGVSGYYFPTNAAGKYADTIEKLYRDRDLLSSLSVNAAGMAKKLFDPQVNTREIEATILLSCREKARRVPEKVYGSRLDEPWIPNYITRMVRKLKPQFP